MLQPAISLNLGGPLASQLSRRFPPQNKSNPRSDLRRARRRSHPGASERTVTKPDGVGHSIGRPSLPLRAAAVKRRDDFRLHERMEQIHPLVRSIQNPRIVPGQTTQGLAVDTEIASGRDKIAEAPRQHNRRRLVANMGESRRPLRNMRHQRGFTLGLATGSGSSSSTCTSRKRPRLRPTINSHRRNAASSRLRRSIVPHNTGFNRNDSALSSMARNFGIRCSARCLTLIGSARGRIPRCLQQPGQTMSSKCSRSVLAHLPQVGHPNHDHEPPLGNLRKWTLTLFSTWPSWTRNSVVSAVMTPNARSREMERLGRSSRYLVTTSN